MAQYQFYAYLDRMKYIRRWQLMRSVRDENVMEHSESVALLTHALCIIHNELFPSAPVNAEKAALYAVYHETSEVMTGDLPTPIKYFNRQITGAYKTLEKSACEKMLRSLPEGMSEALRPYVLPDEESEEYRLMKAADRLSAYVRCVEELKSGNNEFSRAKASIYADLKSRNLPEVEKFFEWFMDSYEKTLDELEEFHAEE